MQLATTQSQLALERARACSDGSPPVATAAPPPVDASVLAQEAISAYNAASALKSENRLIEAREAFQAVVAKYPGAPIASSAARAATELSVIGMTAPPIEVDRWLVGSGPSTSTLTFLVFWEVWCPHCRAELPEMQKTLDRWKSKGVAVTGLTKLTRSATADLVLGFVAENHISFPTGVEKNASMSEFYHVTGVPAAAALKGGVVVWRGHPASLDDSLIRSLLEGK